MLLTGVTVGFGLASGIGWQRFAELHPDQPGHWAGLPGFRGTDRLADAQCRRAAAHGAGLCHLISAAATMIAVFGLDATGRPPRSAPCRPSRRGRQLGIGLLFRALLLFPDGRLPSRVGMGGLADRAQRRLPGRDRGARRVVVQRLPGGQLDPLRSGSNCRSRSSSSQGLLAMLRTCLSSARWCGASSEATSEPGAR